MMGDWNAWKITPEDRSKHDDRFQSLRPIDGFITGEQARQFFTQSELPTSLLAKIWSLADLTADGQLDRREFSIAMFLIKKCLEGNNIPPQLPPSLLQEPHRFVSPTLPGPNFSSKTQNSTYNGGEAIDYNAWSISAALRSKYKLLFNQNDHNKRGYLTGVEARDILIKSKLPQSKLAAIWNLADVDRDGNLTCEEFCIATYLIDQALAGRTLPSTLPPTLMSSSLSQQGDCSKSALSNEQREDTEGRMTFEDKRMQNFRLGQAELDKRKQGLVENLRQEEEKRREKARLELEKQEKNRLERERELQRQAEAKAERTRVAEARRQEAATMRLQRMREDLRQRALETEKSRVEALTKERARQTQVLEQAKAQLTTLQESVASQAVRRDATQLRVSRVQSEVETLKTSITELASHRDKVESECQDLTEQVEAANVELHRLQREQEQSQRQLAPQPSVGNMANTTEQQKTLRANLKQVLDSKRQLEQQLPQLESEVLRGGQALASHRQSASELSKKHTVLATEATALLATLVEKRLAYRLQKRELEAAPTAVKQNDVSKITSTALDAGPSEAYTALYGYTATQADELTFVESDKIQIFISPPFEVCEGWLYGEMNKQRGLVPACYVKKISSDAEKAASATTADPFTMPVITGSSITSTNPFPAFTGPAHQPNSLPLGDDAPSVLSGEKPLFTCVALYNFEAKLPGDLNLQVDETVDVFVDNNGWYEGVSRRTGQRGLFPTNHVQKCQSDAEFTITSGSTTQASAVQKNATKDASLTSPIKTALSTVIQEKQKNGKKPDAESAVITVPKTPELALVVTPFTAQSSEQLSLTVGQYVKIRKRSSNGLWEGEIQQRGQDRQVGWFPADYVRIVSANNASEKARKSTTLAEPASTPVILVSPKDAVATAPIPSAVGVESTDYGHANSLVTPVAIPKVSATPSTDLAIASVVQSMFAYKACQPDELTFPEGALIEVLAHEEEGWWRGRIQSTGVEGLFPVNYIKTLQSDASASGVTASSSTTVATTLKPCARRGGDAENGKTLLVAQDHRSTRQHTILEIIDSECQYLRDLVEVREKFFEGLKKQNVSERKIAQIFGNWTTLCDISEVFNKDFQERKVLIKNGQNDAIGDILVRHLPKCMIYRDYCANQDEALANLQKLCDEDPKIAAFLRTCERFMRVQSMPLSSYLLKPMQRITKCKLLIEKVLKYTPRDHTDYGNLNQSVTLVSTVVSVCDDAIRNREYLAQFLWLQDHLTFENDVVTAGVCGDDDKRLADTEVEVEGERRRRRLLLSGTLFKVKSRKELTAFLFTDMFLLTQPVNFSASDLTSGNFTLPLKPDASMAKTSFKVYRRPISLDKIRVTTATPASPKHRRRSVFHNTPSRSNVADFSSVNSGESGTCVNSSAIYKAARSKRHLSASLTNLNNSPSDGTKNTETATFCVLDDSDPFIRVLVRAPSEELKTMWIEEIHKAANDFTRYTTFLKNSLRSDVDKESLFAAIIDLTVISASDLPLIGPNKNDLPWPYCEVSVCLRSKRTNVILSTRSPKWNCALRFTVKDLTRDVVTIYVYSKNASSVAELLGMAEVKMPEVVKNCRLNAIWKTVLPLSSTYSDAERASVTVSFSLTDKRPGLVKEDL